MKITIKRPVSLITALVLVFTLFLYLPESNLSITADAASNTDQAIYIANSIVNTSEPINKRISENIKCDSPATTLSNTMESNAAFMISMKTWEILNFQPSNIAKGALDQEGYYEAFIVNSLYDQMNSNLNVEKSVESALKNTKKAWSCFKSIVMEKEGIKEIDLLNDVNIKYNKNFMKYIKDAYKQTYPWMSTVNDVFDGIEAALDIYEASEKYFEQLSTYLECYQMSEEVKQVLADMSRIQVSGLDNTDGLYFTTALAKVYQASQSYEFAVTTAMKEAMVNTSVKVFGIFADEYFKELLNSTPLGFGVSIGRTLGKNVSNWLFSTDSICEQYYKLKCMKNYESVVKKTLEYEMEQYRNSNTLSNAKKLLISVDIFYRNWDNCCELAQTYADTVYSNGITGMDSGNEDYKKFSKSVSSIKADYRRSHESIYTSYLYNLEVEQPDIYKFLVENGYASGISDVTGISFEKKAVEWGLGDTVFYNKYASVTPSYAYDTSVYYMSSDPGVVTYDDNTNVKVMKVGTAVITAVSKDGGYTDTMTVNVVAGHGADSNGYTSIAGSNLTNYQSSYIPTTVRHIDSSLTLNEDMVIDGDAIINAHVDLNGHTLTILGNLRHLSGQIYINEGTLNVGGWYKIQNETEFAATKSSGSSGTVAMLYSSDRINIGGDFVTQSTFETHSYRYSQSLSYFTYYNVFTNGILSIGGNFYQYRVNGAGSESSFCANESHKTVFTGNRKHLVHFDSKDSYFAELDVESGSIELSGYFGTSKIYRNLEAEEENITITRLNCNGYSIHFTGDINSAWEIYLSKGSLIIDGDCTIIGNVDLDAGIMNVKGNLRHLGGEMFINEGTLNVDGWYKIQQEIESGASKDSASSGYITMLYSADKINIDGDFVTQSTHISSYYRSGYSDYPNVFQNGVLSIGGDFYQYVVNGAGNTKSFQAGGSHKTVFTGSGSHIVHFDSEQSYFAELEVESDKLSASGYFGTSKATRNFAVENVNVTLTKLYCNGKTVSFTGNVTSIGQIDVGGGNLTVGGNFTENSNIALNGGTMTVNGNYRHLSGELYLNEGTLNVGGWYKIQQEIASGASKDSASTGSIFMFYSSDRINIAGDFVTQSAYNYGYYNTDRHKNVFQNGILSIGGDFYQYVSNGAGSKTSFCAGSYHKTVFTGSGTHNVHFDSSESYFAELDVESGKLSASGYFGTSKATRNLAVENENVTLTKLYCNGKTVSFTGDVTSIGQIDVGGGNLTVGGNFIEDSDVALNGGTMTVTGNYRHLSGELYLNEGTLNVGGWYKIQKEIASGASKDSASTGSIFMFYSSDRINIAGDFVTQSAYNYGYYNTDRHKNVFQNGILSIGGDFYQYVSNGAGSKTSFCAGSYHKTVFTGSGSHIVHFDSEQSYFNILQLSQPKPNYSFSRVPCWSKLILAPVTENDPQFGFADNKGVAGSTVKVQVIVKNNPGIIGLKLNVDYDSTKFTLKSLEEKDYKDVTFGPLNNNPFVISWTDSIHSDNKEDGVIAELTFNVNKSVKEGSYPISISYMDEDVFNSSFENVYFGVVDGNINIVSSIFGDVSDDGKTNMKDLALLQQYLNAWEVDIDEKASDINNDGKINMKDYALLQQYLNGWEIEIN